MSNISLAGKTVFITGASRGIGRSIALRVAREGANVVIAAKTADDSQQKLKGTIHDVAREVEAAGGQALALQVDVRDEALVQSAVAHAVDRFGGIDVLINNAGAILLQPTEMLPAKRFDLIFGVNVRAVFLCSQACVPYLKRSANGHIVTLSPPVTLDERWFQNHTPYTVSKFAMTMMAFGMAAELKSAGVAVNALWPRTLIATAAVEWLGGETLLKGSRTPEIMADAAYEIISSPAAQVTGQAFIDEALLRARGYTDFDQYAHSPGEPLLTDLFVTET